MAPEVETTETHLAEARISLRRCEERRDVSKFVFGISITAAIAVIFAVISGTWYVAKWDEENKEQLRQITTAHATLATTVAGITNGADRWKMPHQVLFGAELQRELRMHNIPAIVPDPYEIKMRAGP
jgi:hypothetical protein